MASGGQSRLDCQTRKGKVLQLDAGFRNDLISAQVFDRALEFACRWI